MKARGQSIASLGSSYETPCGPFVAPHRSPSDPRVRIVTRRPTGAAVTALSQSRVLRAAATIVLRGDGRPVVEGIPEPRITGALRSVGDRVLNVACAMLCNGTQFNPSLESQKMLATGRKSPRCRHPQQ
jgi:hypothetical protein